MIKQFKKLEPQEAEILLKAPILVCILIAGADGQIDRNEIKEAISMAGKNKATLNVLSDYFNEVSDDFEDKLKIVMQNYPYEFTQRNPIVIEELATINTIWQKLDAEFAGSFYEMLLELAEKIATSSGGWLGIKAVGSEEAKYVKLPMLINPSKI